MSCSAFLVLSPVGHVTCSLLAARSARSLRVSRSTVSVVAWAAVVSVVLAVGVGFRVRGELIKPPEARRFSWPSQGGMSSILTVRVRQVALGQLDTPVAPHSLSGLGGRVGSSDAAVVGGVFAAVAVVVLVVAVSAVR